MIHFFLFFLLKETKENSHAGMTGQEVQDAARLHIGDTGLRHYVLKSMNNVIPNYYIVRRQVHCQSNQVLESKMQVVMVYQSQNLNQKWFLSGFWHPLDVSAWSWCLPRCGLLVYKQPNGLPGSRLSWPLVWFWIASTLWRSGRLDLEIKRISYCGSFVELCPVWAS